MLIRYNVNFSLVYILYLSRRLVHVLCDVFKRMKGNLYTTSFYAMIAVNCCHCLFCVYELLREIGGSYMF